MENKVLDLLTKYLGIVVGSLSTALGLVVFFVPNKIAPGGVSGVATIIHHLLGFRVGIIVLLINIPLFLISFKILGKKVGIRTLWGIITLSVLIELLSLYDFTLTKNLFLASIYGGAFSGLGLGIVFKFGGTTGGTDLIAAMINRFFPGISMGKGLLFIDAFVVIAAGIIFNAELALYAIIAIFVQSKVIDFVQEGMNYTKSVIIVSNHSDEIASKLMSELNRGVTGLKGYGGYSGENKNVLLITISRAEITRLKNLIFDIDDKAFVIMNNSHEVYGEGFKKFKYSAFN
ncbi:MAG: YitT family protein [archaeon]